MKDRNLQICSGIEKLYASSIYPDCPKKDLCDDGKHRFSKKPKMPYIGRNYGNKSKVPNLLFISLDAGEEIDNYHTIPEIRKGVEDKPPRIHLSNAKTRHWHQTFDIADILLAPYIGKQIKDEKGISFVDSYIAHTNSAKCTQNKDNRKSADAILFSNCHPFVLKEIQLFDADIIVTQGGYAAKTLENDIFAIVEDKILESTHNGKDVSLTIYIREVNGKKTLHIPMYHPSYFRGYWAQKQTLEDNLKDIQKIVQEIME